MSSNITQYTVKRYKREAICTTELTQTPVRMWDWHLSAHLNIINFGNKKITQFNQELAVTATEVILTLLSVMQQNGIIASCFHCKQDLYLNARLLSIQGLRDPASISATDFNPWPVIWDPAGIWDQDWQT